VVVVPHFIHLAGFRRIHWLAFASDNDCLWCFRMAGGCMWDLIGVNGCGKFFKYCGDSNCKVKSKGQDEKKQEQTNHGSNVTKSFKLKEGVVVHQHIHFGKCSCNSREVVNCSCADFPANGQCAVCNVIILFQNTVC